MTKSPVQSMTQSKFEPGISRTETRGGSACAYVLHFKSSSAALSARPSSPFSCTPIYHITASPALSQLHCSDYTASITDDANLITEHRWHDTDRSRPKCSKQTLSYIVHNKSYTVLGLNPYLRSDRHVPNRLNHG